MAAAPPVYRYPVQVGPRALRIRATRTPNPYDDSAFKPLTDDWVGIPAALWNTMPAAPPAPADIPPPPAITEPAPQRSDAVKFTQQTLQIGSEPQSILPERQDRQYLIIQNGAGGTIYVGFSEIPNASTGIEILVGGSYELRNPAPSNQIYVVCPTATATVRVLEG